MNIEKANEVKLEMVNTERPEITLTGLPRNIINMLIIAYTGNKGEFTASTQYIYDHFILEHDKTLQNIGKNMEIIAINEMMHMDILAKVLLATNVNPKFCTFIDNNPNICNSWSANNINYQQNVSDIMKYNITLEETAIKEYEHIVNSTDNENLREIINRILEDEHSHLKYFLEVYEALNS